MKNESGDRTPLSTANMEPAAGNESVAKKEMPRFDSPVTIHVISYRKRKHDPDGISAKAVLDGIVRAGILADDSWEQVKSITFESRKAQDEEKTFIKIGKA